LVPEALREWRVPWAPRDLWERAVPLVPEDLPGFPDLPVLRERPVPPVPSDLRDR